VLGDFRGDRKIFGEVYSGKKDGLKLFSKD
jgi:hypothetical protein